MSLGVCEIFEVGPRDGLQNEQHPIATQDKVRLIDQLSDAGFSRIEVGSFVSPQVMPQMADAAAILGGIKRRPATRYAALTPNMRGFDEARAAGADEIAVFGAASEAFSRANINASIDESLEKFAPVLEAARHIDLPVRGYISCAIACPYDGPTPPQKVADLADRLFAMGCYEISLGDTIGAGTPDSTARMLLAVRDVVPVGRLAGHFHDTGGRAMDNIDTALSLGLRVFDAAVAGLGGCPFAQGAPGNVATEAVAAHLEGLGYDTGLDLDVVAEAARLARDLRRAPQPAH